ncbi:hypothetical protein [uncultured Erythrobacter sp.]|uniref:hypothetical protein n=1 Tax=uncultured Erythrobacter sp. TaxID=263913 RepID=UPI0026036206|nr:hypothetical protein [uncultured Erythrobacter sp.]
MMPRHLLALFALFSGLAALHAPAQACAVQSVVQDARSSTSSGEASARAASACSEHAHERSKKCTSRERRRTWSWLPSWLRPGVIVGSDRALE